MIKNREKDMLSFAARDMVKALQGSFPIRETLNKAIPRPIMKMAKHMIRTLRI